MTGAAENDLAELIGQDLGSQTASYNDTALILYALSVGARPDQLDLVYERDLRVLPSYACAIGLWAVEACGRLGFYDPTHSLHASQSLIVHRPLPVSGQIEMRGRVANVYDKGKASLVEIEVESDYFTASYHIFLPGRGGWGGERGPSASNQNAPALLRSSAVPTEENLAALYRLTGDRHPVHIDPEVATAGGFERPILHGLCTLGIAVREVAEQAGKHPAELQRLSARLSAPVLPGQTLTILSAEQDGVLHFEARVGETVAIAAGQAVFSSQAVFS